jgi:DNA-binding transcriptional MocR family regulator
MENSVDIGNLDHEALTSLQESLVKQFNDFKKEDLKLDLTRGKPSAEQLDLANQMDGILGQDFNLADGSDARNYGGLSGIPEARQLGAEMLDVDPEQVMVGDNSSLSLMYRYVSFACQHGVKGPESSWQKEAIDSDNAIKFLCPVPGYDRHFTICEHFNIEMININLTDQGPDMDQVEALVKADPMIKGIWCVPKYSNPTGITYSKAVVDRMAKLGNIAGDHFRIMWDNAYAVHYLGDGPAELRSIYAQCVEEGTQDSVIITGSTSKVTFAGAGISFLCASENNLKLFQSHLSASTIGPDKLNQLRHVRFLQNRAGILAHMEKHKAILQPKFARVEELLQEHLGNKNIGSWDLPEGGYFVSFDTRPGLAREVVSLASDVGVKLTPAGATFPYGNDDKDTNIRLAPTFPNIRELEKALRVFVVCVELASVNQILGQRFPG